MENGFAYRLPDGKVLTFDHAPTGAEIAAAIGPGLAKAALAIKVEGQIRDLARTMDTREAAIEIVTRKSADALDIIRHDAAHVMAEAVQELFPGTQVTIGPAIENGFYYDFARDTPFTLDDLPKIEAKMHEIVKRNAPLEREVWDRADAIKYFRDKGEKYKAEIIEDLPGTETITVYRQGEWLDLCRGPHAPSTGSVGDAFKLMKVAGAYWRGDSKNQMLTRIYGTAWRDKKELEAHLTMLEEAEKRDHRKLGREMDLFHLQEEAAGSVFWHPNGWTMYRALETYLRKRLETDGYVEVKTPQLFEKSLFEASGHWQMYGHGMFKVEVGHGHDHEHVQTFGIKPMNCPAHVQIYNHGMKSYRDLPLRMAEFGSCHRNEPSGALHGIMRVRQFTQDDGHIFCMPEQVVEESKRFCALLQRVYADFGFSDVKVKLALRPDVRAGTDEIWDRAETELRDAARQAGLEPEDLPGEGAFYGPKLEYHLTDAIGRTWQCGTLQLDFVLPERLDAEFVAADNSRKRPVMLHRAIFGSVERFIGVLIEHYAGRLPLWLSPTQVVVATITQDADGYAEQVAATLAAKGLRVITDTRNEKINYKVREHMVAKRPILLVVGKREAQERAVAMRRLGSESQTVLPLDQAIADLVAEAAPPQ
ncbi:threonine--tRNA ligase [Roseiterribacter gracilis]|uniref:Threonine--tRNA ligase n=1 Tax=Roseiterribacter gracilis TaxID=2812848 RepID=A0A8S8XDN6_9PROT|nr:threonine--tRNA ligase [Rhodospirillales bacterium TMPK1]